MVVPIEERLHKGAGVRRPDLGRFLAGDFAERLHVFDDDAPELALAKVIWQLSGMIRSITDDPDKITALEVMYNLPRDPELNPLPLQERLQLLHRRHGRGRSPSTTNSMLSAFRRAHVFPMLVKVFPWPEGPELDAIVAAESQYLAQRWAARGEAPGAVGVLAERLVARLVSDASRDRRDVLESALPDVRLHFAVSASGNLVTTRTMGLGEVLAAFTDADLLRQYQKETGAPATDVPTVAVGRRLFDALAVQGTVGLAVNPLGCLGAEGGQYWTPEELATL